jgi:hypothetical protein
MDERAVFGQVSGGLNVGEKIFPGYYSEVSNAYGADGDYLVMPDTEPGQFRIKADKIIVLNFSILIERLEKLFVFYDARVLGHAPKA